MIYARLQVIGKNNQIHEMQVQSAVDCRFPFTNKQCSICRGVGGLTPLVPLNPQVCIDSPEK